MLYFLLPIGIIVLIFSIVTVIRYSGRESRIEKLIQIAERSGNTSEAISRIKEYLEIQPRDASLHFRLSGYYLKSKQPGLALKVLKNMLALSIVSDKVKVLDIEDRIAEIDFEQKNIELYCDT